MIAAGRSFLATDQADVSDPCARPRDSQANAVDHRRGQPDRRPAAGGGLRPSPDAPVRRHRRRHAHGAGAGSGARARLVRSERGPIAAAVRLIHALVAPDRWRHRRPDPAAAAGAGRGGGRDRRPAAMALAVDRARGDVGPAPRPAARRRHGGPARRIDAARGPAAVSPFPAGAGRSPQRPARSMPHRRRPGRPVARRVRGGQERGPRRAGDRARPGGGSGSPAVLRPDRPPWLYASSCRPKDAVQPWPSA